MLLSWDDRLDEVEHALLIEEVVAERGRADSEVVLPYPPCTAA